MTARYFFRFCLCMTFVAVVLAAAGIYSASYPAKTVAHYTVSSMGLVIGDVTTTQRMIGGDGVPSLHFETRTAVKASFLWMGYQQETVERGILRKQDLVSYARKGKENGAVIDIAGRLENDSFRFDVREQGTTRTVVIPRGSYDCTTMECPEARLDFKDKGQVALRVLDVEKLAVVKRQYRLIRNAHYTVAGQEYPCRIVDFSDQNKKARRWIAWDGSTAVVYRQDGRGEKNSYSVQATSLTRKM